MAAGYRALIDRLARLDAEVSAHRREATEWYDGRVAAAEQAMADAAESVEQARYAVREAAAEQERVDTEVYYLWRTLVGRVGVSAERAGGPTPLRPPPEDRRGVKELIESVQSQLSQPLRREPLPESARRVMAGLGLAGGVLAGLAGWGVRLAGRHIGDDLAVVMPVLGLILTLALGPILGLLATRVFVDRRGAVLDAPAVSTVVISALASATLLLVLLR